MKKRVIAYIGLGSNLGDREGTIRSALSQLNAQTGVTVTSVSPFYETAPVGGPPQGAFTNAVAEVRMSLGARELLQVLLGIEDSFGRERSVHWGPRTLDLDLLLYGDVVIDESDLKVPHPLMHERRFVLEPLCAIAPGVTHPLLGRTAAELLAALPPAPPGSRTPRYRA